MDSCATACIVYSMCKLVIKACGKGGESLLAVDPPLCNYSLIKTLIVDYPNIKMTLSLPMFEESLESRKVQSISPPMLKSCVVESSTLVTWEPKIRARPPERGLVIWPKLSEGMSGGIVSFCFESNIGQLVLFCIVSKTNPSYHVDLNMDSLVTAIQTLFTMVTGHKPKFKVHGGSANENLALQNIQVSRDPLRSSLLLVHCS